MAEISEDASVRKENEQSFWKGRKAPVIGCLLVVLFIIALFVAVFVVGTFESFPDDHNNPGP